MARPRYKPTTAQRKQVAVAAGAGMSHEEIALGLKIARNTLELHFAMELSQGAYGKRLETLSAMHRSALKGNVAAQKAYLAMTPRVAVPPLDPKTDEGKKAAANREARTAQDGTEWGNLLPGSGSVQ